MANNVRYQLRSDVAEAWEERNPTLLKGEVGYDITNRRIKFGDGVTAWKELPYVSPDVLDELTSTLTTAALSANEGRELNEAITKLQEAIKKIPAVIDNLTSISTDAPLSANMGRVLDEAIAALRTLIDKKASKEELSKAISDLELLVDSLIEAGMIDVIDNLTSEDKEAALSANQGRVLNDGKVSYGDILNLTLKELENLSSYTNKQVPSVGTLKLLQKSVGDDYVPNANILKTGTYTAIRSAATSNNNNYASQSIVPSMRILKNVVNTVDGYITTLQSTVSKLYSEDWTFTLEDGSTVTKKVSLWSS